MIWPFRRKRKPVHVGPTSVDWKPGDMAECISDNWRYKDNPNPIVGGRFMVVDVKLLTDVSVGVSCICLTLIGYTQRGYDSSAFRKIVLTDTGADRKVAKRAPNPHPQEA